MKLVVCDTCPTLLGEDEMNSDAVLIACITICVIFFAGDPDLHDALIKALMK